MIFWQEPEHHFFLVFAICAEENGKRYISGNHEPEGAPANVYHGSYQTEPSIILEMVVWDALIVHIVFSVCGSAI